MEQRLNQSLSSVTETSAAAVMQVQSELDQWKKGSCNEIQAMFRTAEVQLARVCAMGGGALTLDPRRHMSTLRILQYVPSRTRRMHRSSESGNALWDCNSTRATT